MEPASKDESLPKHQRVRKRPRFLAVQKKGRKLQTESFLVFVLPQGKGRERLAARLGVTVSKKVGGAIERNRVKRRVREAYRRSKAFFPSGVDVVFVAKRAAVRARSDQVVREIQRLCAKYFPR